jgi:ligand-binding sensor domain-containing protein
MQNLSQLLSFILLSLLTTACKVGVKTPPAATFVYPNDPYYTDTEDTVATHGPRSITRNILQDKKGNLWFSTWEGIICYDGKFFTNYTLKAGLAKYHTFSLLEDRAGNLWFGTIGAGAYKYDGKVFTHFNTHNGLIDDYVDCIYEDIAGHIWFGTFNGASRYDGKRFDNFTTADGLGNNDINAIIEDNKGTLWFGTRGEGISYYDGKQFQKFNNHQGLPFNQVRAIMKDKYGDLWFGGNDGLWRYDGEVLKQYDTQFVGYIYESAKGDIWVSAGKLNSRDMVLYRYDAQSLSMPAGSIPKPQSVKQGIGQVFGILEDDKGHIWFGTEDGVCKHDGVGFELFRE